MAAGQVGRVVVVVCFLCVLSETLRGGSTARRRSRLIPLMHEEFFAFVTELANWLAAIRSAEAVVGGLFFSAVPPFPSRGNVLTSVA